MKPETIPGFDCLEHKWKVQAEIYEEIKNLTPDEEIEYFRRKVENGPFAELWRNLRQYSDKAPIPKGHER